MSAMASQNNSVSTVNSTVYSGADQRKHQSSASLAFVWGHRWPVNSPHKGPVTQKMFPFDEVITGLGTNRGLAVTWTTDCLIHWHLSITSLKWVNSSRPSLTYNLMNVKNVVLMYSNVVVACADYQELNSKTYFRVYSSILGDHRFK